jgi:hypothetical protein
MSLTFIAGPPLHKQMSVQGFDEKNQQPITSKILNGFWKIVERTTVGEKSLYRLFL